MKSTLLAGLLLFSFLVQSRSVDAGSAAEFAMVEKVIDGDTIQLANGERVRYIGIDASELSSKECYSAEAKKANEKLTKGKRVKLVRDKSNKDNYGRHLRYVWAGTTFVNQKLVATGAADVFPKSPDLQYQKTFDTAKDDARTHDRGAWEKCQQAEHAYYLSAYATASAYYCDTDPGWKSLSKKYLRKFSTEKEINLTFPSYQLHQPCK